jgi:hypothetical protein
MSALLAAIASFFRGAFYVAVIAAGVASYHLTGRTPAPAYQAMIRLFCLTRGRSNEVMSAIVAWFRVPASLPAAQGLLGSLDDRRIAEITNDLHTHGYCVFPGQLPAGSIGSLLDFALKTPCKVRSGEGPAESRAMLYRRASPEGVRYDFSPADVVNHPVVQTLMADASLLAVAQAYLKAEPLADVTSMWWHTAYSDQPDEGAAQMYHFDMDRIRWLKIFIYLTDVTSAQGPHCFVAGSHRAGGIPASMLSKGYARLSEVEVADFYPPESRVEFIAPAGTIIIEDTRGLHKGKVVESGDRLMLQLQFSNSLFGGAYPKVEFQSLIPELRSKVEAFPSIYVNYL